MKKVIVDILDALRTQGALDYKELDRIIRMHSKRAGDGRRIYAKKHILPHYLDVRDNDPATWALWNVDEALDDLFVRTLQMKPRRSASGVATITVITKPWPCRGECIYCPNDVYMPKSYLRNEPACQRALRCGFDPYLQVISRLRTLDHMGHATEKVELIVLGGTFDDYPLSYRCWFIGRLFAALNDGHSESEVVNLYDEMQEDADALEKAQARVLSHEWTYNDAVKELYGVFENVGEPYSLDDVLAKQRENEHAAHRCVGLVIETRPDAVTNESLTIDRALGCTKIQLGIQSIDQSILDANRRNMAIGKISDALALCRLFGFKTHVHLMMNLLGATPSHDKEEFVELIDNPSYKPDEIKLYPCALVDGTELVEEYKAGRWRPYSEDELLDVLCADVAAAPPYLRISRMVRDISSTDIIVGNKKTNLRQLVEERILKAGIAVNEMRIREVGTDPIDIDTLRMDDFTYETSATQEHFLEWVTPENRLAGFLRLSLPYPESYGLLGVNAPISYGEAMIREVHIYGFATKLSAEGSSAQHHGLGKRLISRAEEIARDKGFKALNVISAVGTREYYRDLGFEDHGLYQRKCL